MSEGKRTDDVEKLLSEQKVLEDRKQTLIDDLLKQREPAIAAFDERLAKLLVIFVSPFLRLNLSRSR